MHLTPPDPLPQTLAARISRSAQALQPLILSAHPAKGADVFQFNSYESNTVCGE